MRTRLSAAVVVAVVASVLIAAQESDRIEVVLPRDAIPAIDKPEFEPAARADRAMDDKELVIGLVGEREQRAYSTWQLSGSRNRRRYLERASEPPLRLVPGLDLRRVAAVCRTETQASIDPLAGTVVQLTLS